MNSSAKTTAISLLAAAALGATIFMGCTVTSGTSDDVDGDTQHNNNDNKDASKGDDANTSTPQDDGGNTATCETKRSSEYIVSPTCQACLDTKCCAEQTTCFAIEAPADESKVDCNDYAACIDAYFDECSGKATQEETDQCFEVCDLTAADGVQAAYEAIESCGGTHCAEECGGAQ